nr:hypothetical protein Ahn.fas.Kor.pt_132 [Ahnfeltia fastigiata]
MSNFWDNVRKFPRFLISVLIGFFLTTLNPVFELLKQKKTRVLIILVSTSFFVIIYTILQSMLGIN